MMSFKDISQIAGSAMAAQTVRLDTIASNLANADTAGTEGTAYRARKPVFAAVYEGHGARVQVLDVIELDDPPAAKYEPGSPLADENGMVYYSNVSAVEEMTDMMAASRAFSTNAEVLSRVKAMQQDLLRLGEG
ncbi:Flagellar basal body rod protein [Burkholderia dolosa AU0158]|nr:Flagellar basal body rod protein [Burkholderia dolosa AU0158]VWB96471.1 flagellar basal body rod protein FlgC [Burkholderia dolosa]